MLIVCGPVWVICASSVSERPATPAVIFTVFGPACVKVTPVPPRLPAAASEPNETNAVALMWSTLAFALLEYPLMCRPLTVAWTLVIERLPPVGRLTGMLLAEMSTLLKSLAASWVRNGKPSMSPPA